MLIFSIIANGTMMDTQINSLHTSKEDKFQGSLEETLQGAKSHGLTLLLGNSKGTGPVSGKQLHCPK